jgi:hypothetical protein
MVSYNFKIENGEPQKSSLTRVPNISKEELEQIVQNVIKKTNTESDEFEELDLSEFSSIDEQIEFLKRQNRIVIQCISPKLIHPILDFTGLIGRNRKRLMRLQDLSKLIPVTFHQTRPSSFAVQSQVPSISQQSVGPAHPNP